MNELPNNLKKAMEDYANVKVELENDAEIKMLNALLDNLMIDVNDIELKIRTLMEPSHGVLKALTAYIKGQVFRLEGTAKHVGVIAKYRSGYDRETWQGKVMTKILLDNPNLAPIFTPARKVTPVVASVTVSYKPEPIPEEEPTF